jgi:hypothetical protein
MTLSIASSVRTIAPTAVRVSVSLIVAVAVAVEDEATPTSSFSSEATNLAGGNEFISNATQRLGTRNCCQNATMDH